MNKIDVFGLTGIKIGTTTLPSSVFAAPIRQSLIEQAVSVYRENQRQYTSQTKGRSDVSGGGKKPWKQKGTGRARQGSTRSAQWRGGGIVFGPQAGERRRVKLTKKMRARMLTSILSWLASEGRIVVLDTMQLSTPGTKQLAMALKPIAGESSAMFVDPVRNDNFVKSLRNVPDWEYQHIDALNVMNLLLPKKLVLSQAAIDVLAKRYPLEQSVKKVSDTPASPSVVLAEVAAVKAESKKKAAKVASKRLASPKVSATKKPAAKKTATTKSSVVKKRIVKKTALSK